MTFEQYANLDYCYLTTTGRVTGEPREIEIWFALRGTALYLMAGGRDSANWVRNIRKTPAVSVRLGEETFPGTGRVVEPDTDEDAMARELPVSKYQPRYSGDLANWGKTALPVAIELDG
ncbi:MAG: nitroreductase family deazaflavin-dependent oxidoreductase [Hyphomicrobiales bacterium]